MLEDMGFARTVPEESGKKIYEITNEGRKHLAENSTTVNDVFERLSKFVEGFVDSPMMDVNQAFRSVARATYTTATSHLENKERLAKIKDILVKAAAEIESLEKATG